MKKTILVKTKKALLLMGIAALMSQAKVNAQELFGGELQSKTEYTYGKVEMRMYSEYVIGTTSTYFWWRNGGQECNYQWNEIDIETLPLYNQYQSNPIWQRYDNDPGNGTCKWLSEGRHADKATVFGRWIVYTLEWCPEYIAWYHDGILDRKILKGGQANDPVGSINKAMRYCYNLWTQGNSPGWLGNLDWNALQNNPVYQWVDYFKYYAWNGTGFNATATKTINFDSDADITNNFNKSNWTMDQSNGHVQWDPSASGVTKLSDGNGVLWLGLGYKAQMHAPYASDIPAVGGVTNVAVTGVTLSAATLALTTPATGQLTATVAPANATNKTVTWTTSNAAVATVSATGLVSSVAAGTATITAKTADGAKVATCVVTVATPPTHTIPGTIEAEKFTAQAGTTTEAGVDAGVSGQNIGYTDAGDYLEYAIEVPKNASYTVDFRVASLLGNAGFSVLVDGVTKITEVAVATTGGYQNWVSLRNTLALTVGKHTLRLNVTKGGFNLNWMDFKEVVVNVAPTVNISAPLTGVTFTSGTTITLTANAADVAPGTVSSVAFYDGAVLLGTDLASPYSFTWAGAGVGAHVITAKATDNNGAITTSAAVTITVNAIVVSDPLTQSFYLMKDVLTKDYMRPTLGSGTTAITQYEEAVQPTFDSYQWEFKAATGGFYYIINKWTKNAIQPTNALVAENTGLSQVAFANQVADEVLWSILPTGGGYYWIKNKKSGLYIRPFNATDGGQGTVAIVQNTLVAGYSSFQWELLPVAAKANAREYVEEAVNVSTENTFNIYPNPASDLINLSAETAWELMDLSGVTLLSGNGKQINSTGLASGVYLIKANGKMHKLNIAK